MISQLLMSVAVVIFAILVLYNDMTSAPTSLVRKTEVKWTMYILFAAFVACSLAAIICAFVL